MGQLHKVDLRGKTHRVVEGELLLGRDSHHDYKLKKERFRRHRRKDIDNPWLFCADDEKFYDIEKLVGEYVVVEYRTPKKSALIQCKGENELIRIYPVNRYDAASKMYESKPESFDVHSSGINVGRLVNAFTSGKHILDRGVILQEGNSGSHFTEMRVTDDDLYYFAVESLKRANKVKVYYVERLIGGVKMGSTGIHIWKIQNLDDI